MFCDQCQWCKNSPWRTQTQICPDHAGIFPGFQLTQCSDFCLLQIPWLKFTAETAQWDIPGCCFELTLNNLCVKTRLPSVFLWRGVSLNKLFKINDFFEVSNINKQKNVDLLLLLLSKSVFSLISLSKPDELTIFIYFASGWLISLWVHEFPLSRLELLWS
jgi:hypothetical protein